jgi:hypothetical protein
MRSCFDFHNNRLGPLKEELGEQWCKEFELAVSEGAFNVCLEVPEMSSEDFPIFRSAKVALFQVGLKLEGEGFKVKGRHGFAPFYRSIEISWNPLYHANKDE